MAKTITGLVIYVDKELMGDAERRIPANPDALFDAAFTHMVKKEVDPAERKRFMAEFMAADIPERQLRVINAWIQVRDVATFPFRDKLKPQVEASSEDQGDTGGVPVDNNPDGQPESGVASDGGDTQDGGDDVPHASARRHHR